MVMSVMVITTTARALVAGAALVMTPERSLSPMTQLPWRISHSH